MHTVHDNINQAFDFYVKAIHEKGIYCERRESRNGVTWTIPHPVTLTYSYPWQRVLWNEARDCNPFFHIMESLWMLCGMNELQTLAWFNKRMWEYSDDNRTQHAAYGYRWRHFFNNDQLSTIISILKRDPETRRAVLDMWAPTDLERVLDLPACKDVPCNLSAVFQRGKDGHLNMTVFNRSNDILWGALGANYVHFSYLLEYIANCVGMPMGAYHQVSCNMHLYWATDKSEEWMADTAQDFYQHGYSGDNKNHPLYRSWVPRGTTPGTQPYTVGKTIKQTDTVTLVPPNQQGTFAMEAQIAWEWVSDLAQLSQSSRRFPSGAPPRDVIKPFNLPTPDFKLPFFKGLIVPAAMAWYYHKRRNYTNAQLHVDSMMGLDWRIACSMWLTRREAAWSKKQNDGATSL